MTDSQVHIDVALVRRLIAAQFPHWADLPVRPVAFSGWDNRTFHLGDTMSVRLPSAAGYREQVAKEQRWLPVLAPHLPLPIPVPVAVGVPGEGYPWPWSVYGWLDGKPAAAEPVDDLVAFATTLAEFLVALRGVDATDGPLPGTHNFYRGGSLMTYDAETWRSIEALRHEIDAAAAAEVWRTALASEWQGAPVWFHGDVAVGNLLVTAGRLSAVIDFGTSGVGDPACDTVIAWTLLRGESRAAFRRVYGLDDATWARGRGWALWKALITLAEYIHTNPASAAKARQDIAEVLADHASATGATAP